MSSLKTSNHVSSASDADDDAAPRFLEGPPRCVQCFYQLEGLEINRCPECGQAFDPEDETTFTRKPPLVWWRIAGPVLWIAAPYLVLWFATFHLNSDLCAVVTLFAPLVFGVISCFLLQMPKVFPLFALLCVAGGLLISFLQATPAGMALAIILFIVFTPLVAIGALLGFALRRHFRTRSIEHRAWLPTTKPHHTKPLPPL